jgi:hypothetical protein
MNQIWKKMMKQKQDDEAKELSSVESNVKPDSHNEMMDYIASGAGDVPDAVPRFLAT